MPLHPTITTDSYPYMPGYGVMIMNKWKRHRICIRIHALTLLSHTHRLLKSFLTIHPQQRTLINAPSSPSPTSPPHSQSARFRHPNGPLEFTYRPCMSRYSIVNTTTMYERTVIKWAVLFCLADSTDGCGDDGGGADKLWGFLLEPRRHFPLLASGIVIPTAFVAIRWNKRIDSYANSVIIDYELVWSRL